MIILSIPWAISIHTVTAFLYNGLPGRPLWLTAILAPRFLASAFASGPALLILLCMLICWLKSAHPPREAVQKLSVIMTYAMIVNVFFVGMEFFTAFYSGIAHHAEPLRYMFAGMEGHSALTPWMWTSMILSILALVLLIRPRYRKDERLLAVACGMVFFSLWIDTGIGLIVAGFIPSPVGEITVYAPTVPEMLITLAIWAIGTLILTVLYKIALSVREEPLESSPAAIAAHL